MDVSNLYYSTVNKFDGKKLDYKAYLKYIEDLGKIKTAIAFGAQMNKEANGFITYLKKNFTLKLKNCIKEIKKNS